MKTQTWISILISIAALLQGAPAKAQATGDSLATHMTIYSAWLSKSGDCSNPVQISSSSNGTPININQSPQLAKGQVPVGTYKCLILEINTLITFHPDGNVPGCPIGVPVTMSACSPATSPFHSQDPVSRADMACTGDMTTGQHVFVYMSRDSVCNGALTNGCTFPNPFKPPASSGDIVSGWNLASDIVISAKSTGHFVFNTDGQVDVLNGQCNLEGFLLDYR